MKLGVMLSTVPTILKVQDGVIPDIGIKISLKVFGTPICVYIGTCILCLQNIRLVYHKVSTYFSLRITSRDRWWWILENHLLWYKFLSPVSNSGVSGTVCNRSHSLGWTARFLRNNTSRWQLHDKKSRWCKKKKVKENYECTKFIFFAGYIIMTLLE